MIYYILLQTSTGIISLKNTTNRHIESANLIYIALLLLVGFCDATTGNGASFWKHEHTDKKTEPDGLIDLEVEMVIQIN